MMHREELGHSKIAVSLVDKSSTAESESKEMGIEARKDLGAGSLFSDPGM